MHKKHDFSGGPLCFKEDIHGNKHFLLNTICRVCHQKIPRPEREDENCPGEIPMCITDVHIFQHLHCVRFYLTAAEIEQLKDWFFRELMAVVGTPCCDSTLAEFEKGYAERSGVTVEWLHKHGQHGAPCDCGEEGCRGWQMVSDSLKVASATAFTGDGREVPSTHQPGDIIEFESRNEPCLRCMGTGHVYGGDYRFDSIPGLPDPEGARECLTCKGTGRAVK